MIKVNKIKINNIKIKKIKKNKFLDEYFVNDTHLKRLYNMYIHQTKIEKFLDFLVFSAIIFTIMTLVLELFFDLNEEIVHFIHLSSIIIVFIFAIELIIQYSKSKTKREFFKKFWLDFILIVFLSFYFLFAPYLGFARFEKLTRVKDFAESFKKVKIFIKTIFEKLF